jgi:hypothetical protein
LTFSERFANGANTIEGNIYIGTTAGTTSLYAANTSNANIVTIAPTAGTPGQFLRSRGPNRTPYWGGSSVTTVIATNITPGSVNVSTGAYQYTDTVGNLLLNANINGCGVTQSGGGFTVPAGNYKITVSAQLGPQTSFTPGQFYFAFGTITTAVTSIQPGNGAACGTYLSNTIPNGDAYTASMVSTLILSANTVCNAWGYSSTGQKIYAATVILEQV